MSPGGYAPLRGKERSPPPAGTDAPNENADKTPIMNQSAKRKRSVNSPTSGWSTVSGQTSGNFQNLAPVGKKLLNSSRIAVPVNSSSTVITGEDRVSASGGGATYARPRSTRVGREAYGPRMEHVLQRQVLAHVHGAVRPFYDTLTTGQRTRIGQTVASRLVQHPDFLRDFNANNRTRISEPYEFYLAQEARILVNNEVKKILDQINADFKFQSEEDSPIPSPVANAHSISNKHRGDPPQSADSRSTSEENVFEQPSLQPRLGQPASPGTAYSFDLADAEMRHEVSSDLVDSTYSSAHPPHATAPLPKQRATRTKTQSTARTNFVTRAKLKTKQFASLLSVGASPGSSSGQSTPNITGTKRHKTRLQMAETGAAEAAAREVIMPVSQPAMPCAEASATTDQVLTPDNLAEPALRQPAPALPVVQGPISTFAPDEYCLRPYIPYHRLQMLREQLARPEVAQRLSRVEQDFIKSPRFHADFSEGELRLLCDAVIEILKLPSTFANKSVSVLMKGRERKLAKILSYFKKSGREMIGHGRHELLRTRNIEAISDLLKDAGKVGKEVKLFTVPRKLYNQHSITALLREREMDGITPVRARRGQDSSKVIMQSFLEDKLCRQSEWTDCSGDISSISWTSENAFIGGALAHSDPHNMQYNKPGNLLLGSLNSDTVRSYPDHKTARPLVDEQENRENSLESMRATQSPWLYDSVVSTAHCEYIGYSFTASFDGTVKIWSVSADGSAMTLQGTWYHDGKVNFVVTSPHHDRIATAFETNSNAVRIYTFDKDNISSSSYDAYCGNRTMEQADELRKPERWAYQPATMQWGKSVGVRHMLLVGYSPRSNTGDEHEIPEDKRNSGELCLWDAFTSDQILISSAKTQNVFEVIWHPTQPIFVAATSPRGNYETDKIRTQIRLFAQTESGAFTNIKTLDCPALDINEVTLFPNSSVDGFVTASCTDGATYVWDTARGDQPIHVLQHGDSLDNPDPDQPREIGDSGVKFAAWGQSSNRFYTGGSDGMVKAWDVKAPPSKAFIRNVLSISGGVSTGVFNQDCSKLLVGDATGKVYLLSTDDSDIAEDLVPAQHAHAKQPITFGSQLEGGLKRPKVIVPHAEPLPPSTSESIDSHLLEEAYEPTGAENSREYLNRGILVRFPTEEHPHSQHAVFQGPAYSDSGFFRSDLHVDGDVTQELLPLTLASQQFLVDEEVPRLRVSRLPIPRTASNRQQHQANIALDFNFDALEPDTQKSLAGDKVELHWDNSFPHELSPSKSHWLWKRNEG